MNTQLGILWAGIASLTLAGASTAMADPNVPVGDSGEKVVLSLDLKTPGIDWGTIDREDLKARFCRDQVLPAGDESLGFNVLYPKNWDLVVMPLDKDSLKPQDGARICTLVPPDHENYKYIATLDVFVSPLNLDPLDWLIWLGTTRGWQVMGGYMHWMTGRPHNAPDRWDEALFRSQKDPSLRCHAAVFTDGPRHWILWAEYPERLQEARTRDLRPTIDIFTLLTKTGARQAEAGILDSFSGLSTYTFQRPPSWLRKESSWRFLQPDAPVQPQLVLKPSGTSDQAVLGLLVRTMPLDQAKGLDAHGILEGIEAESRARFGDPYVLSQVEENDVAPPAGGAGMIGRERIARIRKKGDDTPYHCLELHDFVWVGEREVLIVCARLDFGGYPLQALSAQSTLKQLVRSLAVR